MLTLWLRPLFDRESVVSQRKLLLDHIPLIDASTPQYFSVPEKCRLSLHYTEQDIVGSNTQSHGWPPTWGQQVS